MKSHCSYATLRRVCLHSLLLTLLGASALTVGCGDNFPRNDEEDSLPAGDIVGDGGVEDGSDAAADAIDSEGSDVAVPDGTDGDSTDGDSTDSDGGSDAEPTCDGEPGCPCQDPKQCKSEICGFAKDGSGACFDDCEVDGDCAEGSACKAIPIATKKACVPTGLSEGAPCTNDELCGLSGTVCTGYGHEGSFCALPCKADADCKTGKCVDAKDSAGKDIKACKGDAIPACTGIAVVLGAKTSCHAKDLPGCTAPRKCTAKDGKFGPEGVFTLDTCAPAAPGAETCDNVDQDCDGKTDNSVTCDDGKACTDDSCQNGACVNAPNTGACDDGDACTEGDKCDGKGQCASTAKNCEDGNFCTDNGCDPKTGCALPVNTTKTCDDGDACTEADQCDGQGKCAAKAKSCDDGNTCTDNPCDPKTGCGLPVNTTKTCDDGDACTEADQCDGQGKCLSKPKSCEDGNTCTDNPCDPKTGCGLPVNTTKTCDDSDACTEADQCDGQGKCASKPKSCEDGNTCTDNPCDPKTGCGLPVNTTKTCDDSDACTDKDQCDGKGKCAASPKSCEDGNTCTDNPCDPKTGCGLPVNTTKTCDDSDACTEKDQCDGKGKCAASVVSCEDGNACTDDPCDSKTGCAAKVNSTKLCNDGDACTEKDQCDGQGACKAQKLNCEDGNSCTDDPCDSKTGCAAKINTTKPCSDLPSCKAGGTCDGNGKCGGLKDSCDDSNPCTTDSCKGGGNGCANVPGNENGSCTDGDACTESDACKAGKCAGAKKACDDGNICTADACKDGECIKLPNTGTGCDDGSKCTGKDACKDGVCLGGPAVCEDGLPCTDDPCDVKSGACGFKVLTTKTCDDGLPCTTGTVCDGKGACKGGTVTVCDDKNPCTVDSCHDTKGCVTTPAAAGAQCSDDKPCTVGDACDGKGACVAATDVTGKACDDGSFCTKDDVCDAVKGCQGTPVADCGTKPFVLPYVENFTCNSSTTKFWTPMLTKPGELGWRVDALPALPAPYSADCSLNFNNDKDYNASIGGAVAKTAVHGASIDLGQAKSPTLRFRLAGDWENGGGSPLYDQLDVLVTTIVDGKPAGPAVVVATPKSPQSNTWLLQTVDLGAFAGKVITIGFQFGTTDGLENDTSGPFIDDVWVYDTDCNVTPSFCDDGNACTADGCDKVTGKCTKTNSTDPCEDGQFCTTGDACKDGACAAGAAVTCDDGDACTTNEVCAEAAKGCIAATVVICQDFNPCTADSCDKVAGTCKHVAITGCAPACKADDECPSTNPCLSGACQKDSGTCKFSAANDGNICAEGRTCGAGKCNESTVGWARTVHANPDSRFFCALTVAGKVACWGRNDQGQIGNGNTGTNALSATPVTLPGDVTMVAVGTDHACALQTDGKVYCWGDNGSGQLGDGKTADTNVPVLATEIADAVSIAAGGDFTCWVTKTATAKCVGSGSLGRLGNGSSSSSTKAVDVKDLKDVLRISSLYYHSCALKKDRTVWCWGYNFDRQLINSATTTQNVPVQRLGANGVYDIDGSYASVSWASVLGAFSVGDNSDGQLGNGTSTDSALPVAISGATGIVAVPGGEDHHLALTTTGAVWGAGAASLGQLALAQSADQLTYIKLAFPKAISVDASASTSCVVTDKGGVTCSGSNTYGELGNGKTTSSSAPVIVHGLCKADLDCDDGVACTTGSCKDGKCAFGGVSEGACDDGDACTDKDACANGGCLGTPIVCNDDNGCTVGENCQVLGGAMTCIAGADKTCNDGKPCTADSCEPKNGACIYTPIPNCAVGCKADVDCNDNEACTTDACNVDTGACSYKSGNDGAVCAAGAACNAGTCTAIKAGWAKAIHGSPGADHFCATTQSGELACWGYNNQGQIGNNTTTNQTTPLKVAGVDKVIRVALGSDHSCAQSEDLKVWCWGDNLYNVIQPESTTDALKPVEVKDLSGASDLCAGSDFTCVIKDGKAWCLGYNNAGQLGDGTTTSAKAPVAVKLAGTPTSLRCGSTSACAETSDGAIWCWGANFDKQVSAAGPSSVPVPVLRSGVGTADGVGGGALTHCWTLFGKAWCVGDNNGGQLGDGKTTDSGDPLPVKIEAIVSKIVGGTGNLAALAGTGHVYTIGNNTFGALVDGTSNGRGTWLNVTPKDLSFVDVALSKYATCALSNAGTIHCGGDGFYGQLGQGSTSGQVSFVSALVPCDKDANCDDGSKCTTDVCDGTKKVCTYTSQVCDDSNLCTVGDACEAATGNCKPGPAKSCDDKNECTTDSCDTKTGVCGNKAVPGCQPSCKSDSDCPPTTGVCGVYACVGSNKCVLQDKNNGAVCDAGKVCGGGQCASPGKGWAKQLSSFGYFSTSICATMHSGFAACWGSNSDGQLGDGSTTNRSAPVLVKNLDKVQQISAGYRHTCAIRDSGKVACWGQNSYGQVGNGTASSSDVLAPVDTGLEGATSVCAGYGHSCAVTSDGKVHCWGRSSQGTLGNGKISSSTGDFVTKPAAVPGVNGAVEVGCGYDWTCARTSEGEVFCWGDASYNQSHGASTTDIANAAKRAGLADARSLSAGTYHGCITTTKGAPFCWGYNSNSVTSADNTTSTVAQPLDLSPVLGAVAYIHAGYQNAAAIAADGSLWVWGSNISGQLLDGTTTSNGKPLKVNGVTGVIQATWGQQYLCILNAGGEVKCGGAGSDGQLGNGQTSSQKALVDVIAPK